MTFTVGPTITEAFLLAGYFLVFAGGLLPAGKILAQPGTLLKKSSIVGGAGSTPTGQRTALGLAEFSDHFDRTDLGPDWTAHFEFDIRDEQLINNSREDTWSFLAICNAVIDPDIMELTYGSLSDATGRSFTGLAVMLDAPDLSASGYLIAHNYGRLRLLSISNGATREEDIASVGGFGDPAVGDDLHVEIKSDATGNHFRVYSDGELVAVLNDPQKRFAGSYCGIMISGATKNGVDYFYCASTNDIRPPGKVADLGVVSTTFSAVVLKWTAPGDNGDVGKAARYDLRYSTEHILTDQDFASATPVSDMIAPSPAGVVEQFYVGDLGSGTTYYFALRAFDQVGNISELSNEVSVTTSILFHYKDNFNRADGDLGSDWGGDLANVRVRNNTAQNMAVGDLWSPVVYKRHKNVVEVSLKYGPNATTKGISFSGILLMANNPTSTPNGYLIQRFSGANLDDPADDRTRLWLVRNGRLVSIIEEGQSRSRIIPQAGATITVRVIHQEGIRYFYVYVNGRFDRVLSDSEHRYNGLYAGFMLESTLGEQNVVDEFTAGVSPGRPKVLGKVSGDNQIGAPGQPLPLPLTVALLDSFDNAIPDAVIRFAVTSGKATILPPPSIDANIRLEAEEAKITGPLRRRSDVNAAAGRYIVYPAGQTLDAVAAFTFEIKQAGAYRLWTRSLKIGTQPGSWSISVDGGPDFIYDVFQDITRSEWTWDLVSERGNGAPNRPQFDPKLFNFSVGKHTVVFHVRWEDTWLDKILITSDALYGPSGKEESGFITDASGQVSANVTLGNTAGLVAIKASHGNLPPVTFIATATGTTTAGLVMNSGSGQAGPAGQRLPQPFKVRVQDNSGNGVAGQKISWVVTSGNGRLSKYVSTSDDNGIASTTLNLGNASTTNTVEARAAFTPQGGVVFAAATISGVAANLAVVSGNAQTGSVHEALPAPLVAKVTTTAGQPVPNFPVEFRVTRGGGTLSPHPAISNEGFELPDLIDINKPANWILEGKSAASEVSLSTTSPHSGRKCLQAHAGRAGVGVSQSLDYRVLGSYTLSFYVKVIGGTMRMTWLLPSEGALPLKKIVDVTPTATGNNWIRYVISGFNDGLGRAALSFQTFGGAGSFFVDDVEILRNTDSNGEIRVNWTLGDTAMTQVVQAEAKAGNTPTGAAALSGLPLTGSPLIFSAQANPEPAKKMLIASGNNQSNAPGQLLAQPIVIKATDQYGNGIAGRTVKFTVIAGDGKLNGGLTNYSANTDRNGLAQASWTLGAATRDTNKVQVTSDGLNAVTFIARAVIPGQVTKVPGAPAVGSAGHRLNKPLAVRVTNARGRVLSGYPVVFKIRQGNGTINDSAQAVLLTDSFGEARAYPVLGPTPGAPNKIEAWVNYNGQNLPSPVLTFVVKATRLKEMIVVSGNNQTGTACEMLAQPFKVKVVDSLGAGIKNHAVTFRVTAGGGKLSGVDTVKSVPTDSLGIAQTKLKLGPMPGANQVTATAATALAGSPLTFTASGRVGTATALKKVSGDSLFGLINTVLSSPQVVQITDKCSNGIAGIVVNFVVKAGGGKVNGKDTVRVVTDASGQAQISWQLGGAAGKLNNRLEARAFNGAKELSNSPLLFVASATSNAVRSRQAPDAPATEMVLPKTYALQQNYPNPFNPTTHIRYELPQATHVTLAIYNALGQEVHRLVDRHQSAGYHLVVWNGRDEQGKPMPSGIYHYRLQAGDFVATKKMMMAK